MPLTAAELSVIEAIDLDSIVADLADLVAIPSVGGSAGEVAVQQWCADRLAGLRAAVDHWPLDLPNLRRTPGFPGEEVQRDEAYGCVGVIGDTAEIPGLILVAHTDVVPAGDLRAWRHHPWRLHRIGDHLYGRGSADMKAGLAAILGALAALAASGTQLRLPLAVHAVIGEEDGGLGAYATLQRGHRGRACVIAEPTDACVVPANAGSLTFRLEVPGLAAHASSRRDGYSAVDAFATVLAALHDLEARRNTDSDPPLAHLELPYPISVGMVRAGDWASTVPDLLVAEGRYGVRFDESVETARAEFESAVAFGCAADPWLAAHPVRVSWPGGVYAPGRLPDGHPLLEDIRSAVADSEGWEPAVRGASYGSDLRLYTAAGIPTVQLGPGSLSAAHAVDEFVPMPELLAFARIYALLALRHCG